MIDLEKLKVMIDEYNYPYFDDGYLHSRISETTDIIPLARELCLMKAGIEEMKLGDITIPSPKKHFLMLAQSYRKNCTGVVVRVDGC